MQGNTSGGLLKTTLFLTKTMFTFCIISLIIYLNFRDLQENNANRSYLNLLKSVAEKYHASELLFKDYELKRLDTLKELAPQVYAKHYSSRVALITTLNRYGALITRSAKGDGDKKNTIMLMSDDSLRTLFASAAHDPAVFFTKPRGNYTNDSRDETVGDALNIFNAYPQQEEVILLTAIDTARLSRTCDSLLQKFTGNKYPAAEAGNRTSHYADTTSASADSGQAQTPALPGTLFGSRLVFNGLCVYPNEVAILITDAPGGSPDNPIYNQSAGQGSNQNAYTIRVPAKTEAVVFPSTLLFAGYPSNLVHDLYKESRQTALRNEYGSAKLDMIDAISVAIYNKNNSSISILGFDLSRKWFPIALCLVITILSVLLFQTVSRLRALPAVADGDTDDVLRFLLDNRVIRFFLWVPAPLIILFLVLSSSPVQYSHWLLYGLLLCGAISAGLGVASYLRFLRRTNRND